MNVHEAIERFLLELAERSAPKVAPRTLEYYGLQTKRLRSLAVTWEEAAANWPVEMGSWHFAQTVKRLGRWAAARGAAVPAGLLVAKMPRPGMRTRVLTRGEMARLLWASPAWLRWFLVGQRLTFARPEELRLAFWGDLRASPFSAIVLRHFKAGDRRSDGRAVRLLPVPSFLARHFVRLRGGSGPLFPGPGGVLTRHVLQRAVRKVRGDLCDVTAYTIRHTAATWATWGGVQQRVLQELLGHARLETTARYQHLDVSVLWRVAERARRGGRSSG